ncbi:RadC family protein [Acinetobacter sp. HY1485]|uniref:RadC family protein n=1 Tax=Acinetobacter sp. HY1485 TaxID=2970918 RepID=UPI0022B97DEC|nr:DNA repair protein RadC [Acinetobacter sp. HY1485]
MTISIKSWPVQERPRERLLQQGAQSLSDAELLAIFLRSGSKQQSAVDLSRQLIQHFGSLKDVLDSSLPDLTHFNGIGDTKYVQLMAAKELGRRYIGEDYIYQKQTFDNTQKVLDFLRYELQSQKQEVFAVLCLDADFAFLGFDILFFGTTNYCTVSINHLMRHVIQKHATHIVVAHNHPFAQAQPSQADIELTNNIQRASSLLEIKLVDHCIIAPTGSFSFATQQLL